MLCGKGWETSLATSCPFAQTLLLPPRSSYCQLTNIFQHLLKMKAAAVAVLCFILAAAAVEGYAPVPARAVLGST